MDRRAFLFSMSGLAATPLQWGSEPTPSSPAPPVDTSDAAFAAWMQGFIDRAAAAGWPRERLMAIFQGLEPDPSVIAADTRQPEFSKPVGDYIRGAVSSGRIDRGQTLRAEDAAWLDPIAARYGVPAEILVAIWGMESDYGRSPGDDDVIRSLATLAAEGRRQAWAESELYAALRILLTGAATRSQLTGSWAGAMGQTQFTPSDYLAWGVDGDGDGRCDIWDSAPDALASTANFLANKAAWRRGEGWAREVMLPAGFDYGLSGDVRQPVADWQAVGVRTADGAPFRPADVAEAAGLILPAGWRGPAFLVFPNHFAIRAYNNSQSYALAVGLLADRIGGAPPLAQGWPDDPPLSLQDRTAAQEALARLGFDPGAVDGVFGSKTRLATQAWQRSRSLPADGYLTYALIQRLKAEAGAATPAPGSGGAPPFPPNPPSAAPAAGSPLTPAPA